MEELLTIKELSEKIKFSVKTIYQWTSKGEVPHFKIGGAVRFRLSDIEKWLKKKEIKGEWRY